MTGPRFVVPVPLESGEIAYLEFPHPPTRVDAEKIAVLVPTLVAGETKQ